MNSRDRLSACPLRSYIEKEMEDILKRHSGLAKLKERRRREEIETRLSDQKPLKDVLQDIMKKSPTLSRLFVEGLKLTNPFNTVKAGVEKEYEGTEFPTFFTLAEKYTREKPKNAHKNSKFRVQYKTDVVNDFFDRSKNPGSFRLYENGVLSKNEDINLDNGYGNLNVLVENAQIGDLIHYKSEISDISRAVPISEEFYVKVIEPLEKKLTGGGARKKPASDNPGDDAIKPSKLSIPNIIEVSRDKRTGHDWSEQNFDETSSLAVKGSEEDGYDFFVNIDNIHLLTEIKQNKSADTPAIQAKYKFGIVLIGLAILNDDKKIDDDEAEDVFIRISKISKAISPIIIPMINSLGDIDPSDLILAIPEEET